MTVDPLVNEAASPFLSKYPFHVLTLDGGGSKGVYSLGALKEFEARIGKPLAEHFDLIYGTSTGAIIASLLALGMSVSEIEDRYFRLIPPVMKKRFRRTRTRSLEICLRGFFGDKRFDHFGPHIGIVATNYERARPFIFKNYEDQAFRGKVTFVPGFGCKIADALMASCAAFPFFKRQFTQTQNLGSPELMDGGFVANNPTLFAIADAIQALGIPRNSLRILSVGVGHYNEPQKTWYSRFIFNLWPFKMIEKEFATNTNTIETMRQIFFSDIPTVRVDGYYPDQQYETDLLEANPQKLRRLFVLGQESCRMQEDEITQKLLNG